MPFRYFAVGLDYRTIVMRLSINTFLVFYADGIVSLRTTSKFHFLKITLFLINILGNNVIKIFIDTS